MFRRCAMFAAATLLMLFPSMCFTTTANAMRGSPAYEDGRSARQTWDSWLAGLGGDVRAGADFRANRIGNVPAGLCNQFGFSRGFAEGCRAADQRLGPIERRRKQDAEFRRGWESPAGPQIVPVPPAGLWSPAWPPVSLEAALGLGVLLLSGALVFAHFWRRGGERERLSGDPWWREILAWRPRREHFRRLLIRDLPTGAIWLTAILIAAGVLTAFHAAHYDPLQLDPRVVALPLLGFGIWRVVRDGRAPLQRLAALALWIAMVAAWLGLAQLTWNMGNAAAAAGFAAPHPLRLTLLTIILLAAIRASAWLYVILILEWELNRTTGEYHRVLERGRHGYVLLDQRTWEQRRNEELRARRERWFKLFPALTSCLICLTAALYVWFHLAEISFFWAAVVVIGAVLGLLLCGSFVVKPLALELVYLSGVQNISGSKVFDRRPKSKKQPFGEPPQPNLDNEHSGSRPAI